MAGSSSLILGGAGTLKVDWVAPRSSLLTLTRGPMARKKRSRVQFVLARKPLQLRVVSKTRTASEALSRDVRGGLKALRIEEAFWAEALPVPMTLVKSTMAANIVIPFFLLWH